MRSMPSADQRFSETPSILVEREREERKRLVSGFLSFFFFANGG